jgi:hypothetical protein
MNLGIACIQIEKWTDAVKFLERALTNYERAGKTAGSEDYGNTVRLLQMARTRKEKEDEY